MSFAPSSEHCEACGFVNPAGMLFCGQCGSPLARSAARRALAAEMGETARPFGRQERRRLTLLFCDLVNSTGLAEQMDVEAFDALLGRFLQACTEAVRRHGGFVARYLGDGVLVLFGYPSGMENAASQAVRAARAIQVSLAALNAADAAETAGRLNARIGIATALVVVGDLLGGKDVETSDVRGLGANLAQRLLSIAEPGQIVISEDTQRAVAGEFETRDLGLRNLKGLNRPQRAFAVLGERAPVRGAGVRPRFTGGALLGRDAELGRLGACWASAAAGTGQVVVLRGEPGIGKSRLAHEFAKRVADAAQSPILFECSPYHRNSALHPIATELRRLLGIEAGAETAAALAAIEALVDRSSLPRAESVPLLAQTLLIDTGAAYPPLILTPPHRRERLHETLTALLRTRAASGPLLAIVEDFHWADPSTAEAVAALIRGLADAPVLWVVTERPGYRTTLPDGLDRTEIALSGLDEAASFGLARAVADGSLGDSTIAAIVARAEGVPLFIEELSKNAVEERVGSTAAPATVPASLQDSLIDRLDRLGGECKALAQAAAVLGRRFHLRLLSRLTPLAEPQFEGALDKLTAAGLVGRDPADADYGLFRHVLMRDTAYETLLMRVRRQLHAAVGRLIGAEFPDLAATEPEVLAQHLTLGEQWEQAVDAWLAAAQGTSRRLNLIEAIAQFRHGIGLLPKLPPGPARDARELALQAGLGGAEILCRGYGTPEVGAAFGRAYELALGRSDDASMFPIVWGFWAQKVSTADHASGQAAADQLRLIAETTGETGLRMCAHAAQALTRCMRGDFAGSARHGREGLALYDPARDSGHAFIYTIDPKLMTQLFLQHALWIAGRAVEAEAVDAECLAWADRLGLGFCMPYVLVFGAVPLLYASRWDECLRRLEDGIARARLGRFDYWINVGEKYRGAALIGNGQIREGVALLEQQLAIKRAVGARMCTPYCGALLALGYCGDGRPEKGKALVADMLAEAEGSGEGMHLAEIRRIQGEILLAQREPDTAGAELAFREALELAERQGADGWSLRAALSLATLLRGTPRFAEATNVLGTAVGRVNGRHAAPELDCARALLSGREGAP